MAASNGYSYPFEEEAAETEEPCECTQNTQTTDSSILDDSQLDPIDLGIFDNPAWSTGEEVFPDLR